MHKNILEQWNKNSKIGILEFYTNSAQEESRLFKSFLITFMKAYGYRLENIRNGNLYYHWKNQPKPISINFGFLLLFKLYQSFINSVINPIRLTDVKYSPRKFKN